MPSLREIRRKVKSVKSTQQITKAMKMVAAARLRRAQARIVSARPFATRLDDMVGHVLESLASVPSENHQPHSLLQKKTEGKRGLLLLTADKGLCGAFNTNLIKKTLEFIRENEGQEIVLFCVGRKGRDFFKRMGSTVEGEYVNIYNQLSYVHAEMIGEDMKKFFLREDVQDVTIIYNQFKSAIQQIMVQRTLLPLTPPETSEANAEAPADEFVFEPSREELLEGLFPRHLKAQIFRALLESYASEMGARMSAMENASKNAKDMIANLTLYANKVRQAAITKEISELVGGAEALK